MLGCRGQKGNGRVEGHLCTNSYVEPSSEHSTSGEVCYTFCTLCIARHPIGKGKYKVTHLHGLHFNNRKSKPKTNLCGDLCISVIA